MRDKKFYKLAENTIDNKDYDVLIKFLRRRERLTQSIITKKFEKSFSKYLNYPYSIFINSGSSANLLIAQTLLEGNFLKNKIIVVPAVSWSTSVSPFLQLGYKVIICDSDRTSIGLDIQKLEKICKKYKPGLILCVNVLGHANNYKHILKLKNKFKFELVEDNCESLGSRLENKLLGSFGIASSHSFYFGHHISTIEGGMVSTNNNKFYNIALAIREHGWARNIQKNFKKKLEKKFKIDQFKSLYSFYYSGFNIRSSDLNAKLGLTQLKKIKKIAKIRNRNFHRYKKNLNKYWCQESGLSLNSSFGYATFVQNRLETFKYLKKRNIESRPLICGNIANQPYIKKLNILSSNLDNADFVDKFGIYLPNHANLKPEDIDHICKHFSFIGKPVFFKSSN